MPRMHADPPTRVGGIYSDNLALRKHQLAHLQSGLETPQPPDEDSVFNETVCDVAEE